MHSSNLMCAPHRGRNSLGAERGRINANTHSTVTGYLDVQRFILVEKHPKKVKRKFQRLISIRLGDFDKWFVLEGMGEVVIRVDAQRAVLILQVITEFSAPFFRGGRV